MAIVDNRTALSGFETGDTPAQPDDLTGAAGGTADTEIFIEGSRSYGYYTTSTRDGLLYDAGSAQNWASNTFYIWFNTGIAGLLDTKANGGLAVRFCGATVSDWFEVNVGGSDDYPPTQKGGWVCLVVDIEKAKTASNRTNGTPPATSAIRYVGVTTITGGTMPRMADNSWLDKIWRLPASTPGIRVEGQNTGSVDWTFADLLSWSETNTTGMVNPGPGGAIAINAPIRFGANDAVTHGFSDTNAIVLWEDWDVATSFYGLEVIGGSGTQSFDLGLKSGTGDDATGSQGCVISAASSGERWYFDCNDANIDACNLYGCTFIHGAAFSLNEALTSVISCTFVDCTSALVTNVGDFLRCTIVDANTADGVAFATTDDISDIVFCTFNFSDGHAVELTTPRVASQTSKGNRFLGYGATTSNDAAIYNNSGGAVTITLSEGATSGEHTYRDGTSATTDIQAGAVTFLVKVLDASDQSNIQGARVLARVSAGSTHDVSVSITRSGSTATVTHTSHPYSTNDIVEITGAAEEEYNVIATITVTGANTYTYTVEGTPATPATGSPLSTEVLIDADSNATGEASLTRSYGADQAFDGFVRKGSESPTYVTGPLTGTISSSGGLTTTVQLVSDE